MYISHWASQLKKVLKQAKSETQQLERNLERLNLEVTAANEREETRRVLTSQMTAAKRADDDRVGQRAEALATFNAAETLASGAHARALWSSTTLVYLKDSLTRVEQDEESKQDTLQSKEQ